MSDARPSAALEAGRSRRSLFVAALVALCIVLVSAFAGAPAQAAGTRAQASAGVCGPSRTARPAMAMASRRIGLLGVGEWLGARAATALAEKGFLTGLEAIMRAAGHRNPAEETLRQLGEIKGHLDQVTAQLGRVETSLAGIASAVHDQGFNATLDPLCEIARAQEALFIDFYEPMFDAGLRLTEILAGDDPKQAEQPGANGISPLDHFEGLRKEFMRRGELRDNANDFQDLHTALMPGGERTSVLRAFGKVLLGQRTLNQSDSNRMRVLYRELAELRAIATWMSEEYWSGRESFPHLVERRQHAQLVDDSSEERNLPPMIPTGVVIDVGKGATGTGQKPMWYPAAEHDVKWLPPITVGPSFGGTIRNDGGDQLLHRLNDPASNPGADLGEGWTAPTRNQFEALISTGCVADPTDPERFTDAAKCANAVNSGSGGTVAGYLDRLNEDNARWRQLFCTGLTCPPGAGPDKVTQRRAFIWTKNIHIETKVCGEDDWIVKTYVWRRQMPTYTGFSTLATGPVWHAFPQLRGGPSYGRTATEALLNCDTWLNERIKNAPANNIQMNGVLLATRYTDGQDRNPINNLDYMAQP